MGPYEGAPVEWIHNGKRIFPEKDPKKYEIISDGLTKVLVIKDLKENEQGKFGVKIGETLCSANLQVKGAGEDVITPAAVQTTQTAAQESIEGQRTEFDVNQNHDKEKPK